MSRLPRRSVRLLAFVLVLLFLGQFWAYASERAKTTRRSGRIARAAFVPIPPETFMPEQPLPRPKPKPKVVARAPRKPAPHKVARRQPTVFSGLGVWVDQFDFANLAVAPSIATMRANGVHTLYIQSGESSTDAAVLPDVGQWLAAAHAVGIEVVAWYLPHYADMTLDVARTVAAARYAYGAQRFDGVGVDIEYRRAVKGPEWMKRVAEHMESVRHALGARYPLAAIPPPPLQMAVAPGYWAGFPWASLGRSASEIMLMAYWSARSDCPDNPSHCAYGYTKDNVLETRALAGNGVRIHAIGGVGSRITAKDVTAFVKGARDAHADGASLYDFATTAPAWWSALRGLRVLGT